MRREQAKAMLNCRVHRGAKRQTDHYLLVSSCRLQQLSQPRATPHQARSGYDSELIMLRYRADMLSWSVMSPIISMT